MKESVHYFHSQQSISVAGQAAELWMTTLVGKRPLNNMI